MANYREKKSELEKIILKEIEEKRKKDKIDKEKKEIDLEKLYPKGTIKGLSYYDDNLLPVGMEKVDYNKLQQNTDRIIQITKEIAKENEDPAGSDIYLTSDKSEYDRLKEKFLDKYTMHKGLARAAWERYYPYPLKEQIAHPSKEQIEGSQEEIKESKYPSREQIKEAWEESKKFEKAWNDWIKDNKSYRNETEKNWDELGVSENPCKDLAVGKKGVGATITQYDITKHYKPHSISTGSYDYDYVNNNNWTTKSTTSNVTTYETDEFKKLRSELKKSAEDFRILSTANAQLHVECHKALKEINNLKTENDTLKKKIEMFEKNPNEYFRIKNLDPYGEEIWDK